MLFFFLIKLSFLIVLYWFGIFIRVWSVKEVFGYLVLCIIFLYLINWKLLKCFWGSNLLYLCIWFYGLFFILIIMMERGKFEVFIIVCFVFCLCLLIIWLFVIIIRMLYVFFCLMILIVLCISGVNVVGLFSVMWCMILLYCVRILFKFLYGELFWLKLNIFWFFVDELLNLKVGIWLFLLNGFNVLLIIWIICW